MGHTYARIAKGPFFHLLGGGAPPIHPKLTTVEESSSFSELMVKLSSHIFREFCVLAIVIRRFFFCTFKLGLSTD